VKTYDWIVIGGGITGSCLAYELSKHNFRVLLLEKDLVPNNATVYSYGGLAYWSGTDKLTRQLGKEGIELHRSLTAELDKDTEFRDLDLILTIEPTENPANIIKNYQHFAITPELLSVGEACQLEPLLNPHAISGVLKLPHGHIHPQKTTQAYQQALLRNGGIIKYEKAIELLGSEDKIAGVKTTVDNHYGANVIVCAGGLTRSLLQPLGISVDNYFTHAQLIMTPPLNLKLQTIVMPAIQQRFNLEATTELDWDKPNSKIDRSILDSGAVQFLDGSLCLGQISSIIGNTQLQMDKEAGETLIRQGIAQILPSLSQIQGSCHQCLVAFNRQAIALVGKLPSRHNLYLFSGFTSTLVFAPILARRFAAWSAGKEDNIIEELQLKIT
jgi:glycine/D-amino acid oxidase-like deaminating enzyme